MITERPAIEPCVTLAEIAGREAGREGVLRVDRREDRTDQPEHVGATATIVRPWPLVAANTVTGSAQIAVAIGERRSLVRSGSPDLRWRRRPSTAAEFLLGLDRRTAPARSSITMSRIAGEVRLMSCFDTLTYPPKCVSAERGLGDRHLATGKLGLLTGLLGDLGVLGDPCVRPTIRDRDRSGRASSTSGRATSMKLTIGCTIDSGSRPGLSAVVWWAAARLKISSRWRASVITDAGRSTGRDVRTGRAVLDPVVRTPPRAGLLEHLRQSAGCGWPDSIAEPGLLCEQRRSWASISVITGLRPGEQFHLLRR